MSTVMGEALAAAGRVMVGYGELLAADIPAGDFGKRPTGGVETNTPAWVYGHLSIYPERALAMLGRESAAIDTGHLEANFGARSECADDPDGSVYGPKEALVRRFMERHAVLMDELATVDEGVFAEPNPNEQMRSRFPTKGAAAAFYVGGHAMMHLGQVSAWRRVMGLGPAMK